MKRKVFVNVVANAALVAVVGMLAFFAFGGGAVGVFSEGYAAIYKGNTKSNYISLMFNVYQGNEYIIKILDILERYHCKATFFVGGIWAERNPELLELIVLRGHEIGNHGYFHKDHAKLSENGNIEEISYTHKIVKSITGIDMTLFAPPSGSFNKVTLKAAEELNYKTIMWSRDTIDWKEQDVKTISKRATTNAKGGDLVLMHPTKGTASALEDILKHLIEKGFEVVTVSQNIYNAQ